MKKLKLLFIIFTLMLVGCSNIPKEAPELSIELGKKIKTLEDSHLNLVDSYFDMKRDLVIKFFEDEWLPKFANEFFSNSVVEEKWISIVKTNDKALRMQFILEVAPVLLQQINSQREALLKPLDELQNDLEKKIRNNYDESYAINNSLTSFLISAHKVDQSRKSFVENLGLKEETINNVIYKVDEITEKLVKSTENLPQQTDKYLADINKLKGELK